MSVVRPSVRPSAPLGATRPASARVSEAASPLSRFSHTGLGEGEAGRARNFKAGGGEVVFNNHVVENVPAMAMPARPRLPLPFPPSGKTPQNAGGRRDLQHRGARAAGVAHPGPRETEPRKTSKSLRRPGRRRPVPSFAPLPSPSPSPAAVASRRFLPADGEGGGLEEAANL